MPGIRVQNPVGTDWQYSLDLERWQSDPVFTEAAPGVPLEADTVYVVFCRHQPYNITVPVFIRCGQARSDEDELDTVVKRGLPNRRGWTNFPLKLMGGITANLPATTDELDRVVINDDGLLMRQSTIQSGETIFHDRGQFLLISDANGDTPIVGRFRRKAGAPTSVLEGANLVVSDFEQQWTDDSWRTYTGSYELSMYGNVSGVMVDEATVSVAANSLSQNTAFTLLVVFPGGYSFQITMLAVNASAGGNPPVLVNQMPDIEITNEGDQEIPFPAGQFTGGTSFTVRRTVNELVDEALPTGVTYNEVTDKLKVLGTVANTAFAIRKRAFNDYGSKPDDFLLTVNRSQPAARPNTVEWVQYRFVPNFFGTGVNKDLLEIQMFDGYPEQGVYPYTDVMGIDVLLNTQPAPTSIDQSFLRRLTDYSINANAPLRIHRLASGQNLKNKTLNVYIQGFGQSGGQLLLPVLTITTTTVATNGFVNLYSAP